MNTGKSFEIVGSFAILPAHRQIFPRPIEEWKSFGGYLVFCISSCPPSLLQTWICSRHLNLLNVLYYTQTVSSDEPSDWPMHCHTFFRRFSGRSWHWGPLSKIKELLFGFIPVFRTTSPYGHLLKISLIISTWQHPTSFWDENHNKPIYSQHDWTECRSYSVADAPAGWI